MRVTERPIRVVRVIARLNIGGPAMHVTLLTARLGSPEFESTLVAGRVPANEGDMTYYAQRHGVEPVILETMSREIAPLADLRTAFELRRLLRRWRPDIVHTHTAKAGLVGRLAARLAGVPVIVHTYHGHVLSGYFGPTKERIFRWLERLAGRLSTVLLTVSKQVRDDLVAMHIAPVGKFRVVELGLELERFARARRTGDLRRELGIPAEAVLFGFSGRLTAIKQPELMLQSFAALLQHEPGCHLVILGDGELRPALEALASELGMADHVHFAGFRHELPPLVADLDVMVLTSANEGTPVAVIEAAAAGVPAVCTAVGGVPDVITDGETGWLVAESDAEQIAAALLAAARAPQERLRRGRAAQAMVLQRFSVDRLVDDIAELYRELMAARAGRRN